MIEGKLAPAQDRPEQPGAGTAAEPAPVAMSAPQGDRIFVNGLIREVEIGVYQHEYGVTQRLRFFISVEVAREAGTMDDDFGQVMNYEYLVDAIDRVAAGPRVKLVETFGERVAAACLSDRRARRVDIRIEKLDILSGGAVFGMEISRVRAG